MRLRAAQAPRSYPDPERHASLANAAPLVHARVYLSRKFAFNNFHNLQKDEEHGAEATDKVRRKKIAKARRHKVRGREAGTRKADEEAPAETRHSFASAQTAVASCVFCRSASGASCTEGWRLDL